MRLVADSLVDKLRPRRGCRGGSWGRRPAPDYVNTDDRSPSHTTSWLWLLPLTLPGLNKENLILWIFLYGRHFSLDDVIISICRACTAVDPWSIPGKTGKALSIVVIDMEIIDRYQQKWLKMNDRKEKEKKIRIKKYVNQYRLALAGAVLIDIDRTDC